MNGLFISFEGVDGCGKTTQIKLVTEYLKGRGFDIILTREPGGTVISEKIRELILDPSNKDMNPLTEALLYAASRAQHVNQLIGPSLEAGKIVLCDRFVDSSIAYQGYARNLGEQVSVINSYAVCGIMPDVTFFLDISAEEGKNRNASTDKRDRLELESLNFHRRVYDGYRLLCRENPDRICVIDATRSSQLIFEDIRSKLDQLLLKYKF